MVYINIYNINAHISISIDSDLLWLELRVPVWWRGLPFWGKLWMPQSVTPTAKENVGSRCSGGGFKDW